MRFRFIDAERAGLAMPIEGFTGKDVEEELLKIYEGIAGTLAKRYGS